MVTMLKKVFLVLILAIVATRVGAQDFTDGFYRLTTKSLGDQRSLDVANDGANDKVELSRTRDVTGQYWKITPLGDGFYRLTTEWLGETRSLDVINDGKNNRLRMAPTENVSGQFWRLTRLPSGYFRLTTKWLGHSMSLDGTNIGLTDKVELAPTGDFARQLWRIVPVERPGKPLDNAMTRQMVDGFTLIIRTVRLKDPETIQGIKVITESLAKIKNLLTPEQFKRLRKVPIWFEYKRLEGSAIWYHPNADWLVSQGYPAEMEKSIEINNLKNFLAWQALDQPFILLHELAHAYEDLHLTAMRAEIVATYNKAVAGGKYENVERSNGGDHRHYALTSEEEYFAELTETYFGRNDFYPFTRAELRKFDPDGYKLIQKAWK